VWLMVPAGETVDQTLGQLTPHLAEGDIVIDGGNSNYQDSIRRAKALGFSLDEIGDLLGFSDQRGQDMAQIRDSAVNKLSDIQQRINELQRMHGALKQLVDACPGHGDQAQCPILTALTEARQ